MYPGDDLPFAPEPQEEPFAWAPAEWNEPAPMGQTPGYADAAGWPPPEWGSSAEPMPADPLTAPPEPAADPLAAEPLPGAPVAPPVSEDPWGDLAAQGQGIADAAGNAWAGLTGQPANEAPPEPEPAPAEDPEAAISKYTEDELIAANVKAEKLAIETKAEKDLAALREDNRRADANEQMSKNARDEAQAEMAEIQDESEELANTKIDPGRYWKDANVGQVIGGALSAVLGGMLLHKTGGRNAGLDMIEKAINRDIDAQKTDLMNQRASLKERRGIVSELYAQNQDVYRSAEIAREAAFARVSKQITAEMALYDPNGTAARKARGLQIQLEGRRAVARAQAEKEAFDRKMTLAAHNERVRARQAASYAKAQDRKQRKEFHDAKMIADTGDRLTRIAKDTGDMALRGREVDAKGVDAKQKAKAYEIINPRTGKPMGQSSSRSEAIVDKQKQKVVAYQLARDRLSKFIRESKKLGAGVGGRLGSSERRALEADAAQLHQSIIKQISGAAVSEDEAQRIIASLPGVEEMFSVGDKFGIADNYLAKLDGTMRSELITEVGLTTKAADAFIQEGIDGDSIAAAKDDSPLARVQAKGSEVQEPSLSGDMRVVNTAVGRPYGGDPALKPDLQRQVNFAAIEGLAREGDSDALATLQGWATTDGGDYEKKRAAKVLKELGADK